MHVQYKILLTEVSKFLTKVQVQTLQQSGTKPFRFLCILTRRSSAITAFHRTISLLIYVLPPFLFNVSLASVDLGSNREMMPETQKEDETWRAKIPDSPD
jgi:hypothetical protein